MSDDRVVGIDLGTTNSLIGTVVDGRVRLFADPEGNTLLPSAVGMDDQGRLLVGRTARNRRLLDPEGTVLSVKRRMGTPETVRVGSRSLSPAQVSALILGELLDRAERDLGTRPRRAVITVPAWFDDAQREATRDAGEIAGLTVERLVNEPTAAAMTYQTGIEEQVLVYDFGGGTFDVSILERDEGFLEVRTSRGDTRLGGDDIDQALAAHVLERLGPRRTRVEADPRARVRLLEVVERAKIALSDRSEVRLFDPFLAGQGADAVHLDLELTRQELEQVAAPFVERTLACVSAALRDARLSPADLQRVLLVGGTSRMPLVARRVAEHLGRPAFAEVDADRAVAAGAALLAGRIAGDDVADVLVDITPHSLSAGALDDSEDDDDPLADDDEDAFPLDGDPDDDPADDDDPLFGLAGDQTLVAVPIIPRDTVIPVERTRTLYTIHIDQRQVMIPIAQGEHRRLDRNRPLGRVTIGDLPPSPPQSPVDVVFRLDLSGILHVTARHVPSGRAATVVIADSPTRLTAQRREAARAEVRELRRDDSHDLTPDLGPTETDLDLARALVARAERALQTEVGSPEVRSRLEASTAALTEAIAKRDPHLVTLADRLSDALLDLV